MVTTHFPPFHIGGDAAFVDYLSRELAMRGNEVHVLFNPSAYRVLRGGKPMEWPDLTNHGVHLHPYSTVFGRTGPIFSLLTGMSAGAVRKINRTSNEIRPDVVHWHNTKGFVSRPFSLERAISFYTAHDYLSVCPRSNLIRPDFTICESPESCQLCLLRWRKPPQLWRFGGNRVIRFDDGVNILSPSRFVKQRLMGDGIRVTGVLGNFVPDDAESTNDDEAYERRLILYIGMLEPHKGPKTLLKAFHQTSHQQGFSLVIVGDGSQKTELREMVSHLRLNSRVKVPGFIPKMALQNLMSRAAILAVPSEWYEVFGLVVIEAFSKRIPVMGSNIGALPEILGKESGSFLFEPGDPEDMGRTIVEAWNERDNLPRRGIKARTAYAERYTPERHLREYFDLIGKSNVR